MPMSESDGLKAANSKCFENIVAKRMPESAREWYTYINVYSHIQ